MLLAMLVAAPLVTSCLMVPATDRAEAETQPAAVDLTGRWQLNADLSDKPPQPGEAREPGGGRPETGRPPGGRPPGGAGGYPGGGRGGGGRPGGGMRGGGDGRRPNPEDVVKMRDAMRAVLDAPREIIVTRKDDEVVFTATETGDVTRILVTGKKMKTTAGGAEHDVKGEYKQDALLVESTFGPIKVVDTWRLTADGRQLERITKLEGGRGDKRDVRRIYDRVAGPPE
jgi:hypothetical protein